MSLIRRMGNFPFSYLTEKSRQELIMKSIRQSPERVERSKDYKITGKMEIDVDEFLYKDRIIVTIPVNDYTCTIEFNNVIECVAYVADRQYRGNVNIVTVEKALSKAVEDEDSLKVNCTCPDFYYRFSYVATRGGYKFIDAHYPRKDGYRQQLPANIRNPNNNLGSFCKHLLAILKSKKNWIRSLASVVNYIIKEYYLEILQIYDLDASTFFINQSGKHTPNRGAVPTDKRSKLDKTKFTDVDDEEDSDEELELNIT